MPTCIQLTHQVLLEHCQNSEGEVKDRLLEQYAKLCLLNWHLPQPIKVEHAPLKEHFIKFDENHSAIDNHGNPINTKQMVESEEFVVVHEDISYRKDFKKTIINNSSKFHDDELIIIDYDIAIGDNVSIPDIYICSEIFFVQSKNNRNRTCNRLIKEKPSDGPQWVTISDDDLRKTGISGDCIHAFKKYEEIVVSKDAPLLGFDPPFHGKCWIYPVRRFWAFPDNRKEAETFLREKGRMEKLVPDYIVELIQKYNVLRNENLSKEEIHNAYIRLILDSKVGFEKPSEQKK